jgi:hypothetical protein
MKLAASAVLLCLFCAPAPAVELVLDGVTANQAGREIRMNVGGRATFDFDPVAGVLTSSGSWMATWQAPNQYPRFSHKVEDMRASAAGDLSMRSYECVEGTFGAELLAQNICGRYSFGANLTDDGGAIDDEVKGEPVSLIGWKVAALDWDGKSLRVVLAAGDASTDSLTLRFSLKPPPR